MHSPLKEMFSDIFAIPGGAFSNLVKVAAKVGRREWWQSRKIASVHVVSILEEDISLIYRDHITQALHQRPGRTKNITLNFPTVSPKAQKHYTKHSNSVTKIIQSSPSSPKSPQQ